MKIKPNIWSKVLAILALPLLILSLVFVSLAVDTDDFDHKNNLSRTGKVNHQSGPPQMRISGDTIAIVWSDGYELGNPSRTKDFGNIYLKTAKESEGYWRGKLKVFEATADDWGTNPDIVFDKANPDLVHIVWAEGHNCGSTVIGEDCELQDIKYSRCDISGNINSCVTDPQDVLITGASGSIFRFNPRIAIDDDQDLHVTWSERSGTDNKIYYSRRDDGSPGWSTPSEVGAADGGKDAQLLATTNGRLHLVWKDDTAKRIKHFYDDNNDGTNLGVGATVNEFRATSGSYRNSGTPDNPTVEALDSWLFIGFDVENPDSADTFALFYTMSADNGGNWSDVLSIPQQDIIAEYSSPDIQNVASDLALKPNFAITSTGAVTRVHAVWHEEISVPSQGFPDQKYRIRLSDLPLTEAVDFTTPDWNTPVGVTYAVTQTISPVPPGTTNPSFNFTNPKGDGSGHIAYLETIVPKLTSPVASNLDVYYEGGISGTIDPAYIIDEFDDGRGGDEVHTPDNPPQFKAVTPTVIQTSTNPLITTLDYVIAFTNTGNLDAVGVGITDTLPGGVTFNAGSFNTTSTPAGAPDAVYNSGARTVTWFGTVNAGQKIEIVFSVQTTSQLNLPTTVRNTLEMWNIGSPGHAPFITNFADTLIAQSIIYMPIIQKQ